MEKYQVLNPEALIDMKVSFGFYTKMFQAADYLIKDKDKKEIETFYEMLREDKPFDKEWMEHYKTILIFLTEFQKISKETGNMFEMTEKEFTDKYGAID